MDNQSWSERVEKAFTPVACEKTLPFSVIIPTHNCAERLILTLDSIKRQNYKDLEVILIDAKSRDRTLEVASDYHTLVTRIYSVTDYHLFEMINRGLSLASGTYITILFPGSCYLSDYVYERINGEALSKREPALICAGSIQREKGGQLRLLSGRLSIQHLRSGINPTSLPACFFHRSVFEKLGKFRQFLSLRALFDYLCRLKLDPSQPLVVWLDKTVVDCDQENLIPSHLMRYLRETWWVLETHFGTFTALFWFLGMSHLNVLRQGLRVLRRRLSRI